MGSTPWALVHSINRCSLATARIRSCNLASFSMRGNHLAYAATQGIEVSHLAQPVLVQTSHPGYQFQLCFFIHSFYEKYFFYVVFKITVWRKLLIRILLKTSRLKTCWYPCSWHQFLMASIGTTRINTFVHGNSFLTYEFFFFNYAVFGFHYELMSSGYLSYQIHNT